MAARSIRKKVVTGLMLLFLAAPGGRRFLMEQMPTSWGQTKPALKKAQPEEEGTMRLLFGTPQRFLETLGALLLFLIFLRILAWGIHFCMDTLIHLGVALARLFAPILFILTVPFRLLGWVVGAYANRRQAKKPRPHVNYPVRVSPALPPRPQIDLSDPSLHPDDVLTELWEREEERKRLQETKNNPNIY